MQIASLADAASKMAMNKLAWETFLETWAKLGKEQGAPKDYVDRMERAAALAKQHPDVESAMKAIRAENL